MATLGGLAIVRRISAVLRAISRICVQPVAAMVFARQVLMRSSQRIVPTARRIAHLRPEVTPIEDSVAVVAPTMSVMIIDAAVPLRAIPMNAISQRPVAMGWTMTVMVT